MKTKESKAQIEVWEWKEKGYESVKNLPLKEQIRTILERNQNAIEVLSRKNMVH